MTHDEIRNLPNDDVDRLIAMKIFNLKIEHYTPTEGEFGCDLDGWYYRRSKSNHLYHVSQYSEDITAAMRIIDKWDGDFELLLRNKMTWRCTLFVPSHEYVSWNQSAARAICEARLFAFEDKR